MKKISRLTLVAMALLLSACDGSRPVNEQSDSITSEKDADGTGIAGLSSHKSEFKMSDLDWNVDEGIIDGERYVLMSYTNNSPYIISGLEIVFTEKNDLSDEERETYYSDMQQTYELREEDMEDFRAEDISMHIETDRIVPSGGLATNINCYYYNGYYYVKDINHYNLVEPDMATVNYIDNDKIYTINYDFKSDKYTLENESIEAYQWSKTALGEIIPKPEVPVVEVSIDDEDTFWFDAHGMSLDQYNTYIEELKGQGYIVENSYGNSYEAYNSEGYSLDLSFDDDTMSCHVNAPDESATEEITESETQETVTNNDELSNGEESGTQSDIAEVSGPESTLAGIRLEFQEAMDSYEAFIDEYCTFMEEYADSDGIDTEMLSAYNDYMDKYIDFLADFEEWSSEEMSTDELSYYIEVQSRVSQKLIESGA